jgi:diguanylate cyclase (GGDEF)-like protein
VFVALGSYSAAGTLHRDRAKGRTDAAFQATLASRAVGETFTALQTQVANLSLNPALASVLADPSNCGLSFSDIAFFPHGHLDLVLPDGRVACSSLVAKGAPEGASHAGSAWLATLATAKGVFVSEPAADLVTGRTAVVVAAPVVDAAGTLLGAAVVVAPLEGTAAGLADILGGPQHYEFSLTTADGKTLLSTAKSTSAAVAKASTRSNPVTVDGMLYGSQPIADRGWRVFAGVRSSVILGPTHSVLLREAELGAALLILILLSLTVVHRRIARPLRHLTETVSAAGHHAGTAPARVYGPTEVIRLAEAFNEMIAARDAYEVQLAHQALHDPLTGLPNRALLADRLTHALEQATSTSPSVGVLFVDLDHFKLVNDSLGHAAGDQVLSIMAGRLAEALPAGSTLARFGGDEFVIVCERLTSTNDAVRLANTLSAAITPHFEVADRVFAVTASIGISFGGSQRRAEDLIREADTAMYVAKDGGRARCELFNNELRERVTDRLLIETELREATHRNELWVAYQPKIDLDSGETVGVEALLRWDHPALGSVPPMSFIPIAEDCGLIVPIGEFVLREAVRQTAAWAEQGHRLCVSVNISGRQLLDDNLPDLVARILAEAGLPPQQLCLELTESVLMSDAGCTTRILARLHQLGVTISIDDFGTGYSSLAYLQRFPVDELKIDRTFINDLTRHESQRALVTAMIAMGKALGLNVVAEGVETSAQADQLRLMGCHLVQGYLYGRPGRAEELTALLDVNPPAAVPA